MSRYIWAALSFLAGLLTRRPTSGRWLAHYFIGNGKPRRLPRRLEAEVLWHYISTVRRHGFSYSKEEAEDSAKEWQHVPPGERVYYLAGTDSADLYTSVGTMLVWEDADHLHYVDVYNWQGEQSWWVGVRIAGHYVELGAKDCYWSDKGLGTEFVTRGTIPLDGSLTPVDRRTEEINGDPPLEIYVNRLLSRNVLAHLKEAVGKYRYAREKAEELSAYKDKYCTHVEGAYGEYDDDGDLPF